MAVKKQRILIVGSGGNGISPAVFLRQNGIHDFRIITKHSDFGGAWFQNTYPGCEADTPSILYQLPYYQKFNWKSHHATQTELAEYFQAAAKSFNLYDHADFECEMLNATWSQDELRWYVKTSGDTYVTDFLVLATGFLEEAVIPDIEGKESFRGRIFHTSNWPEGYTGRGDRIAVVGTGSSGIQVISSMQKAATQLFVFQRTPTWVLPKYNREIADSERPDFVREVSQAGDMIGNAFRQAEEMWEKVILGGDSDQYRKVAEKFLLDSVSDPNLREKLTPTHMLGCKRPLRSDDYYFSIQQPNVTLVPFSAKRIKHSSVEICDGREFLVDTIVLSTGFFFGGNILGKISQNSGNTINQNQGGRPRAYKSVSVSGCPNLILCGGPAPNGQLWNGIFSGVATSKYLLSMLNFLSANGHRACVVKECAELEWKSQADAILSRGPAVSGGCLNYSQDSRGNNKATWPGSLVNMSKELETFDADKYLYM